MSATPPEYAGEVAPVPRSGLPGVRWPAVPGGDAATMLALLFQLERSEWWSAEEIRRRQFRQLDSLLAHARAAVPFYRDRLRRAGLRPGRPLDPESWSRLPPLGRREVQQAGPALHAHRVPPGHGASYEVVTSGSTGTPVRLLASGLVGLYWRALTVRGHLWYRRDFGRKLAAIRHTGGAPGSGGPLADDWGPATSSVFDTGPAVALPVTTSIERQAEWLRREDPDYLVTHPTNLEALIRHCAAQDYRPARLRDVCTLAEVLDSETRALARSEWGVRVFDMYSCQEAGYLALQCPEREHHHVQSESVLVEILDESGAPCLPGQMGRVVITPLHNFASPLLRYEPGDFAEVGPPCPCGRGLPVLARILGRSRNMLRTPDGNRYWPQFGNRTLSKLVPVVQHQFVQKDLHTLEVRLVTARPVAAAEEEKVREHVAGRLPHPFRIVFRYPEAIPRSAGGKYEDFVSEVAD